MTREGVRTQQGNQPPKPARMIPVTIKTTSPLTVQIPGGAIVAAVAVAGLTYTTEAAGWAFYQEPAIIAVFQTA